MSATQRLDPERISLGTERASVGTFDFDVHAMIKCDDAPRLEGYCRQFDELRVNKVNYRKSFSCSSFSDCVTLSLNGNWRPLLRWLPEHAVSWTLAREDDTGTAHLVCNVRINGAEVLSRLNGICLIPLRFLNFHGAVGTTIPIVFQEIGQLEMSANFGLGWCMVERGRDFLPKPAVKGVVLVGPGCEGKDGKIRWRPSPSSSVHT